MTSASATVAARIRYALNSPARELVGAYYTPEGKFAGATFESLGENSRDSFGLDDLLALTLLDLALSPPAVRQVLGPRAVRLAQLLGEVPDDIDLWEATDQQLQAAGLVHAELDALPGVGPVKAGKLLARKRPRLIPVIDKHVVAALALPNGSQWRTMRAALAHHDLWKRVERSLRGGVPATVPTLRLLDAAIWMRDSTSRNAREVRASLRTTETDR